MLWRIFAALMVVKFEHKLRRHKQSFGKIGRFQKISIPYHGRLLGFPKGRGGSRLWNSEGMGGGYLRMEIRRHGGIPQVRDFWSRKCEFLENAIVVDFCSS